MSQFYKLCYLFRWILDKQKIWSNMIFILKGIIFTITQNMKVSGTVFKLL